MAIRGGFGSSVQIGIREEWRRDPNSKHFGNSRLSLEVKMTSQGGSTMVRSKKY